MYQRTSCFNFVKLDLVILRVRLKLYFPYILGLDQQSLVRLKWVSTVCNHGIKATLL